MKIKYLTLAFLAFCAACSSPKVAYKFDYHDYNAGRKAKEVKEEVAANPGVMPVQPEALLAMETASESVAKAPIVAPTKTYEDMTKKERRVLRHELKSEIKKIVKKKDKDNPTSVEATKALDKDLKLAIIFGAVGVTGLLLSGIAYPTFAIIGAVAFIIGVVFLVKWLIRQ